MGQSESDRCIRRAVRGPSVNDAAGTRIACSLTAPELRNRASLLLARFRSVAIQVEEMEHGYTFRIPGDAQWIELLGRLIVAERECCPFLSFEMEASPNLGPVTLRVTGPEGAKKFLRSLLLPREWI